jgi:hypothetical protein
VQAIFFAHLFIVLYDLLFAWSVFSGFKIPTIYTAESPFTIYGSSSRMNFVNLNTLTFTTPILFLLLLARFDFKISRVFQSITFIATFFLLIISGRRSVMLMVLVLPLVPFFFSGYFPKKIKILLLRSTIFFVCIISLFLWKLNNDNPEIITGYTELITKAFDADKEPVKFAQEKMLIEKFKEKPLFGHGFGAMFFEPSPGRMYFGNQFELSYHFKLATTGVIGFVIIVGVYLWIFFYGLYVSKKNNDVLLLSFLIGYFFMLVADATNPVLCSFDLIWPIYICLARVNYWSVKKDPLFFQIPASTSKT